MYQKLFRGLAGVQRVVRSQPRVAPALPATAVRTARLGARQALRDLVMEMEAGGMLELTIGDRVHSVATEPDYHRINQALQRVRGLLPRYLWLLEHDVIPFLGCTDAARQPTPAGHAANEFRLLCEGVVRPFLERNELTAWSDERKQGFRAELDDLNSCCERIFQLERTVFLAAPG